MTKKTRVGGSGGGLDDSDIRKQAAALGMVAQAVSQNETPHPVPLQKTMGHTPGEDQEHQEGEVFVNSSLLVREVVTQIADEIPGESVDFSGDEGGEIDGFSCENSCGSAGDLEPFDPKLATLYWPWWDGHAIGS